MVLLLSLAVSLCWALHVETIAYASRVTESAPIAPAIEALMVLTLLASLPRGLPRLFRPSRFDILPVYMSLRIAAPMPSLGVVRPLFPRLAALYHFAEPENDFECYQKYVPNWVGPLSMWTLFLLAAKGGGR